MKYFDRNNMTYFPLSQKESLINIIQECVSTDTWERPISPGIKEKTKIIAGEIIKAKENGASVICAFGAHAIKNGLGRLLGQMLAEGWFTHLASNGATVIHDWEFAFSGKSSEDVQVNAAEGRFGTWEETGLYINLALALGAYNELGYGKSIGLMINNNGLHIPEREIIVKCAENTVKNCYHGDSIAQAGAAALDLYEILEKLRIPSGFLSIPHPYKDYSLLAAAQVSAQKTGNSFTCHPMFGHDIIYTHKANRGAVIGRTAEADFLEYVSSVSGLEGGVYLSVGSAVMSPMIFEKALSMARNAAGKNNSIRNCNIHVVDLNEETWNWEEGEPPKDNPAYYMRFMKTFSRMGCKADYLCADNRDFFISLYREIKKSSACQNNIQNS